VDIATPKPTLHRFLQLKTRLEDLLLRSSILAEQESKQKNEELQKRLKAKLGPGPMKGPEWHFTYVVDEETKASVFTDEEFKAWLGPSKELVAIEQNIDGALAEMKTLCSQLPFDDVIFCSKRYTFSEWFAQKLRRRRLSNADAGEYLILHDRIVAHLAEIEPQREAIGVPNDPDLSGKRYRLPATRPSDRSPKLAYTYDVLWARWKGPVGPLRSASIQQIIDDANESRSPDDKERDLGGITASTVRRLLLAALGE
jgi:hypothetical protein